MTNIVVMAGRLGADPELRYTPNGVAVCTFNLAVNRPYDRNKADFFPVIVWRELAETIAEHCRKGRLVTVQGWMQTRSWDKDGGGKGYATELVADRVEFGAKPKPKEGENA